MDVEDEICNNRTILSNFCIQLGLSQTQTLWIKDNDNCEQVNELIDFYNSHEDQEDFIKEGIDALINGDVETFFEFQMDYTFGEDNWESDATVENQNSILTFNSID